MYRLAIAAFIALSCIAQAEDWNQWRGPKGDGRSSLTKLPIQWSSTENIAWRIKLAEPGNSTPIVVGDKVLVTQAQGKERLLLCFSLTDGSLLWSKGIEAAIIEPTHSTNPMCSSSPASDGERIIVWHGSAGLFCYDLKGDELWRRELGEQKHIWGYGSSPVIAGDLCYLNFGPGERSFLIAVDKKTGETKWQHNEPIDTAGTSEAKFQNADFYGSWSTPVVRNIGGIDQLIISFPFRVRSFEPKSGQLLWSSEGINALVYTSPLIEENIIVTMGGYNGMALGLKYQANERIERLWQHPKTKQRIGSGAIHNGYIFIHNDPGVAECFELTTGKLVWEKRLAGPSGKNSNWSSVMIADGNCYSINQSGDCFVFRASPEFELLSVNSLGETSNSSIVPSTRGLLIRTHQHLWCIGAK